MVAWAYGLKRATRLLWLLWWRLLLLLRLLLHGSGLLRLGWR